MYLLDTNIVLELLLDQENADEVERFLRQTSPELLYLSEFAMYSLGVILFRHRAYDTFLQVVNDLVVRGGVHLVRLRADEMSEVSDVAQRFDLDFDDAYQYVAARKHHLTIVSFDKDFDRTERGRQTPREALRQTG